MDIRQWLAETESPVASKRSEIDQFLLPRQPDPIPKSRRRRKRGSSDSSLLKTPSPQPNHGDGPAVGRARMNVRKIATSFRSHGTRSDHSGSADSSAVSHRYTRKPRRKTRLDKYEPTTKKAKEQDESRSTHRKSAPGKSKRKSKRNKDGKTNYGVGQEFRARDASKARLTLKPPKKLGLFGKGRRSAPVKGRGLPDLVFSEMKFLQNNEDGQDHATQASQTKNTRRKDHARIKEEDISAFFTTARAPLALEHVATVPKPGCSPISPSAVEPALRSNRTRRPSDKVDAVVCAAKSIGTGTVSCPKAGSEGPSLEDDSYISWSDSIRSATEAPVRVWDIPTAREEHLGSSEQETVEVRHGRHSVYRQQAPASVEGLPATTIAHRDHASSVVPKSLGLSTMESPLGITPLKQRPRRENRGMNRPTNQGPTWLQPTPPVMRARITTESHDSCTNSRSYATSCASEDAVLAQIRPSADGFKETMSCENLQQPAKLGKVTQRCKDVPRAEYWPAHGDGRVEAKLAYESPDRAPQTEFALGQSAGEASTVRFSVPCIQMSSLPSPSGASFYMQREQQQVLPPQFDVQREDAGYMQAYCHEDIPESDMLDSEDLDGFSGRFVSHEVADMDAEQEELAVGHGEDGVELRRGAGYTAVVGPGFWRPNRLY